MPKYSRRKLKFFMPSIDFKDGKILLAMEESDDGVFTNRDEVRALEHRIDSLELFVATVEKHLPAGMFPEIDKALRVVTINDKTP